MGWPDSWDRLESEYNKHYDPYEDEDEGEEDGRECRDASENDRES